MSVVSGRVVLKETGVGIPDVLVVVYDADPGTVGEDTPAPTPSTSAGVAAASSDAQGPGDRIGSRLTDASRVHTVGWDFATKIDKPSRHAEVLSKSVGVFCQSSLHLDSSSRKARRFRCRERRRWPFLLIRFRRRRSRRRQAAVWQPSSDNVGRA